MTSSVLSGNGVFRSRRSRRSRSPTKRGGVSTAGLWLGSRAPDTSSAHRRCGWRHDRAAAVRNRASPSALSHGRSSRSSISGQSLQIRSCIDALRPLLVLHAFRFIGLSFLVPGVVSPNLPLAFARDAAYGDIVAAILALAALATLRSGVGIALVWAFNLWGSFDLLNAFYQANAAGLLPGQLGAAYFIPTAIVPLAAHNARIDVSCVTAEPARASGGGKFSPRSRSGDAPRNRSREPDICFFGSARAISRGGLPLRFAELAHIVCWPIASFRCCAAFRSLSGA